MGKLLRRMRGFKTSCKCIMRDIVINSIGGGTLHRFGYEKAFIIYLE